MARSRLSFHRNIDRNYLYDKENGDIIGIMKYANNKLNNMKKVRDEVETFVSATKEYVRVSRTVIENLRYCTSVLEAEVKEAEEAILASERASASLKSEIDSDFQFIHSRDHQQAAARRKTSNGAKGIRWCRNAANKFNRNVSKSLPTMENENLLPINLVKNERMNPENHASAIVKSKTNFRDSDPDYRPTDFMSLKNSLKCPMSDSDFENDQPENCDRGNSNASSKNRNEEMCVQPSCEIDDLSLRKINQYETSSDSMNCRARNSHSESESDYSSYRKQHYNKLLNRNLCNCKKPCESEIGEFSSWKTYRNLDIDSTLSSDDDVEICSTEAIVDSSETDDEFSENRRYLLSLNQTENNARECDQNLKSETPLSNSRSCFQSSNTFLPINHSRDSDLVNTGLNQLAQRSSGNCSNQHIPLSDIEFSEFNDIQTFLPQEGNLNNKSDENWLDAVESLKDISLQSKSSKECSKLPNKNYSKTSISEDKMITSNISNPFNLGNFQNLCRRDQCSGCTDTLDSLWNGETLLIENSTKPYFKENTEEFKLNESLDKSINKFSSIIEDEETSKYISMNSSFSSSKTAYFSFLRETLGEDFDGEKFTIASNASACNYLDTPPEDTTDTSVYDFSSDVQQDDNLSTSAHKSPDMSTCNESSDVYQLKSSSSMSLTEISSNTSRYENSNSFQFHSDSSKNENSSLNACASSFSMSKELSSLSETDLSYALFREGLPTQSLDSSSSEESSCSESLKVNISQDSEGRNLTDESSEVAATDFSKYPSECNCGERSNEVDVHVSISTGISCDESKKVSDETENNFKKSRPREIFTSAPADKMTVCLPFDTCESFGRQKTDITKCSFRRAKSYREVKKGNGNIYSESIRTLINNNHCIL